jgi:hypothetical protein
MPAPSGHFFAPGPEIRGQSTFPINIRRSVALATIVARTRRLQAFAPSATRKTYFEDFAQKSALTPNFSESSAFDAPAEHP